MSGTTLSIQPQVRLDYGKELLDRLISESEASRGSGWRAKPFNDDPYWYRAQYVLSLVNANSQFVHYSRAQVQRHGDLRETCRLAVDSTTKLVKGISEATRAGVIKNSRPRRTGFPGFLQDILAPAVVMWAGTVSVARSAFDRRLITTMMPADSKAELADVFEDQKARGPKDAVDYIRENMPLNSNARYNLACFFAIDGFMNPLSKQSSHAAAILELRLALIGLPAGMRHWASHDPCLQSLKTDPETQDEFRNLVHESD